MIDQFEVCSVLIRYAVSYAARDVRLHVVQMHNTDVMIREDVRSAASHSSFLAYGHCLQITTDDLVDVILGTRKYVPCLYWSV